MIATQGHGGEPILKYVEEFEVQYSLDGMNWINVTGDGTGIGTPQVRTNVIEVVDCPSFIATHAKTVDEIYLSPNLHSVKTKP